MMNRVVVGLLLSLFTIVSMNLYAVPVYACGDTEPGGAGAFKLQGHSFVEDPNLADELAPWIAECNCAEVLTILLENDFEIINVSGIQGPPGVVYTLVRNRPDFSQGTPPIQVPAGVAVVKCGKAGPCGGDTGGCDTSTGDTGGCETPH